MSLTQVLQEARQGNTVARAKVIQTAYEELRQLAAAKMAREDANHTLTATALVNEVSMRMLTENQMPTESRKQFFGYAAKAMRNLLIDHARSKGRQKRGGGRQKFSLEEAVVASHEQPDDFLALNEATSKA